MKPELATQRAAELADLVRLSANPAWKAVLESALTKARDMHLAAATEKSASPAERAEHIQAYHLAKDLLALVPERIRKLRDLIAAHQAEGGIATFKMGDSPLG